MSGASKRGPCSRSSVRPEFSRLNSGVQPAELRNLLNGSHSERQNGLGTNHGAHRPPKRRRAGRCTPRPSGSVARRSFAMGAGRSAALRARRCGASLSAWRRARYPCRARRRAACRRRGDSSARARDHASTVGRREAHGPRQRRRRRRLSIGCKPRSRTSPTSRVRRCESSRHTSASPVSRPRRRGRARAGAGRAADRRTRAARR